MLYELFNYFLEENSAFLVHILNIIVLIILIILFISARRTRKEWSRINDYLGVITKTVNSIRYGDLTKKIEKMDFPNSEQLVESINRMIETLYDREKMIVEYQNELHRQNKLLEAAINSLSDGLIILDENYRILRATPQITEWFEMEGKSLMNKSIFDFIELPKMCNIENINNVDINVIKGKNFKFTASSMELKMENRKKRFMVIIKNITDQRELETLKEDFVATLTHDLKVPIIAETNMLELFLNGNFGSISPKQELALKNMQTSNRELLELVQTVLDTYKTRDGSITLYKENILLKGFINEIIEEMEPIASKTHNQLTFNTNRDIRVYADRMQLKRVIKNLIQNAISYSSTKTPIEITIGEIPQFIVIKVKDYGSGISKTDIDKIFNKYYSAAKKFRKIGTGLGLYLAQQIIKSHGGDLNVESEIGNFTEFTIKLPAVVNISLHYGE